MWVEEVISWQLLPEQAVQHVFERALRGAKGIRLLDIPLINGFEIFVRGQILYSYFIVVDNQDGNRY